MTRLALHQRYTRAGRPGGAELPKNWYSDEPDPAFLVVHYEDERAFREWCRTTDPVLRVGEINLLGLNPLLRAEIQWGLFCHLQHNPRTRWAPVAVQSLVNTCRQLDSLIDLDLDVCSTRSRVLARQMLQGLRPVYVTPSETREAGYLELDHFGTGIRGMHSHYDLSGVSQRWLRDLLWDYLANLLRTPGSPRTRAP